MNLGEEINVEELKDRVLCAECVGEAFLKNEIDTKGKRRKCSYCGSMGRSYSIDAIATQVEQAFEDHFVRTSSQPDDFQSAMMRDEDSTYEWEREGQETVYAIMDAAVLPEAVARDIQQVLADKHFDFDSAAMGDETEFDSDAHYAENVTARLGGVPVPADHLDCVARIDDRSVRNGRKPCSGGITPIHGDELTLRSLIFRRHVPVHPLLRDGHGLANAVVRYNTFSVANEPFTFARNIDGASRRFRRGNSSPLRTNSFCRRLTKAIENMAFGWEFTDRTAGQKLKFPAARRRHGNRQRNQGRWIADLQGFLATPLNVGFGADSTMTPTKQLQQAFRRASRGRAG
jgi:hypothetical protein